MDSKHLTIGALALTLGFVALAEAQDTQAPQTPDVTVASDGADSAGCGSRCNGECGSGS